jgi:hypothetical protein
MTMKEVGGMLGMNESRVSQIGKTAGHDHQREGAAIRSKSQTKANFVHLCQACE